VRNRSGRASALVFAEQGGDETLARYFFESDGAVREDSATGSACANLGGWHLSVGHTTPAQRVVFQGEQISRASTLHLTISESRDVYVGGLVNYLGRGEVTI
jgi:predicted PhzF superfamily epimerase YddE/YHI9